MSLGHALLSLSRVTACLAIMAVYAARTWGEGYLPLLFAAGGAVLVLTSAVLVGWLPAPAHWRRRLFWAELPLVTLLAAAAAARSPGGPAPALFIPPAVTLFLILEPGHWLPALLAIVGGWVASGLPQWLPTGSPWLEVGLYGGLLCFGGAAGYLIRSLGDAHARVSSLLREVEAARAALAAAHRQLQEQAAREQELAVLAERQRIAREIHDSVAHALTALVVQIQVGRRLLAQAPAEAAAAIARSEELARQALQETRQAVRALHPAGSGGEREAEVLARLGREFGAATGMQVEVTADPAAAALPPDPERLHALCRIFQEALTNAHRHGRARQVRARLAVEDGVVYLSIWNDGAPPEHITPGVGIQSMRARARALGGVVSFHGEGGAQGFEVQVAVPIRQEAAEP